MTERKTKTNAFFLFSPVLIACLAQINPANLQNVKVSKRGCIKDHGPRDDNNVAAIASLVQRLCANEIKIAAVKY